MLSQASLPVTMTIPTTAHYPLTRVRPIVQPTENTLNLCYSAGAFYLSIFPATGRPVILRVPHAQLHILMSRSRDWNA